MTVLVLPSTTFMLPATLLPSLLIKFELPATWLLFPLIALESPLSWLLLPLTAFELPTIVLLLPIAILLFPAALLLLPTNMLLLPPSVFVLPATVLLFPSTAFLLPTSVLLLPFNVLSEPLILLQFPLIIQFELPNIVLFRPKALLLLPKTVVLAPIRLLFEPLTLVSTACNLLPEPQTKFLPAAVELLLLVIVGKNSSILKRESIFPAVCFSALLKNSSMLKGTLELGENLMIYCWVGGVITSSKRAIKSKGLVFVFMGYVNFRLIEYNTQFSIAIIKHKYRTLIKSLLVKYYSTFFGYFLESSHPEMLD